MMEHYELKYGMNKGQTRYFEYLHNVVTTIDDDQQRRTLENAMFSAYMWLTPQHYTINVSDQQKMRAIYLGLSLNLIRSGMCSNQHIDSETSNSIVDKLYNIYVTRENIKPRVDINPDNKILK
jgi:hypothetical protein